VRGAGDRGGLGELGARGGRGDRREGAAAARARHADVEALLGATVAAVGEREDDLGRRSSRGRPHEAPPLDAHAGRAGDEREREGVAVGVEAVDVVGVGAGEGIGAALGARREPRRQVHVLDVDDEFLRGLGDAVARDDADRDVAGVAVVGRPEELAGPVDRRARGADVHREDQAIAVGIGRLDPVRVGLELARRGRRHGGDDGRVVVLAPDRRGDRHRRVAADAGACVVPGLTSRTEGRNLGRRDARRTSSLRYPAIAGVGCGTGRAIRGAQEGSRMARVLVLALALALGAPALAAAQTAEPAGSPRIVIRRPAPAARHRMRYTWRSAARPVARSTASHAAPTRTPPAPPAHSRRPR
jgi:hypothetical protein